MELWHFECLEGGLKIQKSAKNGLLDSVFFIFSGNKKGEICSELFLLELGKNPGQVE